MYQSIKLQKYVYLSQTCLKNDFGCEYNIYSNGPYSPDLANYYYENLNLNDTYSHVKDVIWNNETRFTDRFLDLFKGKEPEWLEVASTLIDSLNYCENEQESLNKAYMMKSDYSKNYIDDVWNELKNKNLVHYESGLKLNNLFSVF